MTHTELKETREAAGLSQAELAQAAGVSRSLVAFAERGLALGEDSTAKIERALKRALREAEKKTAAAKATLTQ